jgi:activator of HSP90 ATPase
MQFEISQEFKTTPQKLYQAWLNSELHTKMTGSKAIIKGEIGFGFSAWDGYITGKNLELVPNQKIKQAWRTTEFDQNQEDSLVEITFEEIKPNLTKLTLKHSNLSIKDEQYKQGWEDFYFKPMKAYFNKLIN